MLLCKHIRYVQRSTFSFWYVWLHIYHRLTCLPFLPRGHSSARPSNLPTPPKRSYLLTNLYKTCAQFLCTAPSKFFLLQKDIYRASSPQIKHNNFDYPPSKLFCASYLSKSPSFIPSLSSTYCVTSCFAHCIVSYIATKSRAQVL